MKADLELLSSEVLSSEVLSSEALSEEVLNSEALISGALTTMEALMIALSGVAIVFMVLGCLAILIGVNAKVIGAIEANKKPVAAPAPAAAAPAPVANPQEDEELVAVLMAAIAEETQCDPGSFQITSVVEKR